MGNCSQNGARRLGRAESHAYVRTHACIHVCTQNHTQHAYWCIRAYVRPHTCARTQVCIGRLSDRTVLAKWGVQGDPWGAVIQSVLARELATVPATPGYTARTPYTGTHPSGPCETFALLSAAAGGDGRR